MKKNLSHHGINNLKNLENIEDDDFWCFGLPFVFQRIQKKISIIDNSIRLLPTGLQEVVNISREEVFVILSCMFLGILPKQVHEENVSFGELMTKR